MREPLTPADCNLQGLPYMPVDVIRLLDSDFWALSTGDEFKAAMGLWARSWSQVPAASLSSDERVLARHAGVSLAEWRQLAPQVLRGWVTCSDGRLYHPVVAEKALVAWLERLSLRRRSAAGNAKRYGRVVELDGLDRSAAAARACLKRIAPNLAVETDEIADKSPREPAAIPEGDQQSPSGSEKTSEEKRREEKNIPVGAPTPPSHAQEAWRRGPGLLVAQGRMKEAAARKLFGAILRDHKLEPAELLPSIMRAELNGSADPQGYLVAAAKAVAGRSSERVISSQAWGDDQWRTAVTLWKQDPQHPAAWSDQMGPTPGAPGCEVPAAILAEFGIATANIVPMPRRGAA